MSRTCPTLSYWTHMEITPFISRLFFQRGEINMCSEKKAMGILNIHKYIS